MPSLDNFIKKYFFLIFGVLLSVAIRTYFILHGSDVGDIHSLHEMGQITLKGFNPYLLLNYNSYPPLALYLEIITIKLSELINIPFYILIKIWPNLADFITGGIIYWFLIKKGSSILRASLWSLIFLLNPISIIISSTHGQIDSITTLFVTIAGLILIFHTSKKRFFVSSILLGLAISVKPNPLILLPAFLIYINKKANLLMKVIFTALTFAPAILLFWPYLAGNVQYISGKLFAYSGSNDFGLAAFLRLLNFYQNASYHLPYTDELLSISRNIFIILLILFLFIFRNSKNIIKLSILSYLLFLTVYFGISAQYLSWILALAVLLKDKMIIPYTVFGCIALFGYYMYFNPALIINEFGSIQPYNLQYMLIWVVGNILLWLTNLFWIIKILIRDRV